MTLETWIAIFTLIAAIAASVSAVIAIVSIRRRPKLVVGSPELSIDYAEGERPADTDQVDGTVHILVSNLGRATAHNVEGWFRFDRHNLEPVREDAKAGVITLTPITLRPCSRRHRDVDNRPLGCTLRLAIPVRINSFGLAKITYYLVSDEGVEAGGELQIEI